MSLKETLKRIEKKLEKIEADIREIRHHMLEVNTANAKSFIQLPDHLRKTAIGLLKIGQGTAGEVSKLTGRARAVESDYLNQLERQGFVTSFRKSRQKIFVLERDLRPNSDIRKS